MEKRKIWQVAFGKNVTMVIAEDIHEAITKAKQLMSNKLVPIADETEDLSLSKVGVVAVAYD